jgi:hypothetical protein
MDDEDDDRFRSLPYHRLSPDDVARLYVFAVQVEQVNRFLDALKETGVFTDDERFDIVKPLLPEPGTIHLKPDDPGSSHQS